MTPPRKACLPRFSSHGLGDKVAHTVWQHCLFQGRIGIVWLRAMLRATPTFLEWPVLALQPMFQRTRHPTNVTISPPEPHPDRLSP